LPDPKPAARREGGHLRDILLRPRVFRGLLHLRSIYPEETTATGFHNGTGYSAEKDSAELRMDLAAWRLVETEEERKPIPVRLTEAGRRVADLAAEIEALVPGITEEPRALLALVVVLTNEPAVTNSAALRSALELGYGPAGKLRARIVALDLVTVEQGLENRVPYVRIRLTALGRKVATLALRIQQEANQARR